MSVTTAEQVQPVELALTGQLALPRVNLLPPEIAERARMRRLQMCLCGGLVATLGVVVGLYVSAAGNVDEAAGELEAATARTAALQAQTAEFAAVPATYARAEQAQAMLTAAMGQEVRYSALLDDLTRNVPDDVWLKSVTFTQGAAPGAEAAATGAGIGTVTFTGMGFRHDDVAAWLESLAEQQGYADPYFTDSTLGKLGDRPIVSFSSSVTLTAAALSGRFTPTEQ